MDVHVREHRHLGVAWVHPAARASSMIRIAARRFRRYPANRRSAGSAAAPVNEITSEMISAGALISWKLEGEAPKEALARAVYLAMA